MIAKTFPHPKDSQPIRCQSFAIMKGIARLVAPDTFGLSGWVKSNDYPSRPRRSQTEMSEFFVADGLPDQSFLQITEIFHPD